MNPILDIDAQGLTLGSALKNRKIRALVMDHLSIEDYGGKADKELFRIVEAEARILPESLSKEANERLLKIESSLMVVPKPNEIIGEIRKIQEKTALRRQRDLMLKQLEAIEKGATASEISTALLSDIARTMGTLNLQVTYTAHDIVDDGKEQIEQWKQGNPHAGLVPTGIAEIDQRLGGLVPSHVSTIGGRPSQGKTTLALQIFRNVALRDRSQGRDAVSVFISLDMTPSKLGLRLASSLSSVDWDSVRRQTCTRVECERFEAEHDKIKTWPIVVKKLPAPTPEDLINTCELEAAGHKDGISLIVVDFIEQMRAKGTNETAMVGNIILGLKVMAEHFKCPVLALSQLSRAVEETDSKIPEKWHLRQSGMIEAVSEQILLVHYPAGYQTEAQARYNEWPTEGLRKTAARLDEEGANYLVRIEKNRDFRAGFTVPLLFEAELCRFAAPHKRVEPEQSKFVMGRDHN